MGYQNYLNINTEEKERNIYRVMSVSRLIELFNTRQNTLSKPCLWDDPFENVILQSRGILRDGRTVLFGMRDSFYGQCWTFNEELDAMWRIYSPNKDGVKIRTNIIKLFESLHSAILPRNRDVSCFIGKVQYLTMREFNRYLDKPLELESTGAGIAKTLLIKREAFSYENEVRLIYWAEKDDPPNRIFQYNINPFKLIDEIVFDPRMDRYLYVCYGRYLKQIDYQGTIIQSDLYKAPENIFIKIP